MTSRAMKDSGVEWIGEIPEEWEVAKFKYIMKKEKDFVENYTDEDVLSLTKSGVIVRDLENPTGKMPATFNGYQYVEEGDLLLCLFDIDVTPRCVGIVNNTGITSPAYSRYKLKEGNSIDYYNYFLTYLDDEKLLVSYTRSLRNTLPDEYFGAVDTLIPSLSKQQKIAQFLEEKVSHVNSLLSDTKESYEALKKYKQSLITETVTRGLNPDVSMKDSGIEWIGEIPKHWILRKVKHLTSKIGSGKTPRGGADVYLDSGILFLRSQNIYERGLYLEDSTYIPEQIDESMKNTRVYPLDVLLNITGGSIGRACIYPEEMESHANVNQHVCIIRPKQTEVLSSYLFYYLISNVGQNFTNYYQTGGNREGLNFEQISNISIPVFSLDEQQKIVDYLDEETVHIDSIVEQKEQLLVELELYKKSLIYEYVTGKKEVM